MQLCQSCAAEHLLLCFGTSPVLFWLVLVLGITIMWASPALQDFVDLHTLPLDIWRALVFQILCSKATFSSHHPSLDLFLFWEFFGLVFFWCFFGVVFLFCFFFFLFVLVLNAETGILDLLKHGSFSFPWTPFLCLDRPYPDLALPTLRCNHCLVSSTREGFLLLSSTQRYLYYFKLPSEKLFFLNIFY